LAEFGLIAAQGLHKLASLIAIIRNDEDARVPGPNREKPAVRRLAQSEAEFHSGREFAAWLGLVPRQNSAGGKTRLGGISKRGDSYLRRLLVNSRVLGAHAALLPSKAAQASQKLDAWLSALSGRRPRCRRRLGEQDSAHRLGDHDQTPLPPIRGGSGIACRAAAEPQASRRQ
jgi:transposase